MIAWVKENKVKFVAALFAVALVVSVVEAAENPQVIYKTNYGWGFLMPDGSERVCGLETQTTVRCIDKADQVWMCDYQDPPVYFSDCKEVDG